MKKIILLLLIICSITEAQAKIWRINNDPTKDPDVLQPNTLFDGTNNATNPEAANGDTIHIEPSATAYNAFTINKQVVILGNGFFLSNNTGLQVNGNNSEVGGNIIFAAGSENSLMSGIHSNFFVTFQNVANITITRCLLANIQFTNYATVKTGISITKNFIFGSITGNVTAPGDVTMTIENNIFNNIAGSSGQGLSLNSQCRGLCRNNVFGTSISNLSFNNFYFTNNIIVGNGTTNILPGGNNVIKNNLNNRGTSVTGGLPAADGNQNITDVQMRGAAASLGDVFAGDVFNNTSTTPGDARFELRVGGPNANPANATGETIASVVSPNLGAYGATDPYKRSGLPAIPSIYGLTVPASVAPTATNMNVTISTRSNN